MKSEQNYLVDRLRENVHTLVMEATHMDHKAIGFSSTEEMYRWMHYNRPDGPCCIVDNWTYGRIEFTPGFGWHTINDEQEAA